MSVSPPIVSVTVLDGGLGNTPASPSNVVAVFGAAQSGDDSVPTPFSGQPSDVIAAFGYGPGPSLVAALVASGVSAIFTKVPTSTPGSVGSVTHDGTGLSVMSVTGTPNDSYDIIVSVVGSAVAGAVPGPSVQVSFDGNVSQSRALQVPSALSVTSFVTETGLTFTFTAATMVAGDTYTLSTVGPLTVAADVADAMDALRQTKLQAALLYNVGPVDEADAAVISGALGLFQGAHRYVRMLVEAVDQTSMQTVLQWMTALETDFADFEEPRMAVAAGYGLILDPVTRFSLRRSVGFLAIVRLGTTPVGLDPSQVASGPLVPFSGAAGTTTVYYDEQLNPGLGQDGRFFTLTSYNGRNGYYVACPCLMSGPTSDFDLFQLGRLMDESCRVADLFFTGLLGSPVRVNPRTGFIIKRYLLTVQSGSDEVQANALVSTGQASSIATTVSATDNILSTKTLTVTILIVPNGDIRRVNLTMSFTNPALRVAA